MSVYTVCVIMATAYLVSGSENKTDISNIEQKCNSANKSANYVNIKNAANDLDICYKSFAAVQLNITTLEKPACDSAEKLDEIFDQFIEELQTCDDANDNLTVIVTQYNSVKHLYRDMLRFTQGKNETDSKEYISTVKDAVPCLQKLSIDTIYDCLNMTVLIPDFHNLNPDTFNDIYYTQWHCDKGDKLKKCTLAMLETEPLICKPEHIDFIMDKFNLAYSPCREVYETTETDAGGSLPPTTGDLLFITGGLPFTTGGSSTLLVSHSLLATIALFLVLK